MPLLILAVTESGGAFAFFNNDFSQSLIMDGNTVADQLGVRFLTTSANFQEQSRIVFYLTFHAMKTA